VRKFTRRTMLVVVTGVLLTAGIAFAVSEVSGTETFDVQTADVEPVLQDLAVTVTRTNEDAGPISEDQRARYDITVQNPNTVDVTLGPEAVVFTVSGGEPDCTIDDLQFNDPDALNGATIPAGGEVSDSFSVKLRPGSGEQCDDVTLSITVTVTGETVDEGGEEEVAEVSGSSSL
jgi:hypothetical protein